MVLMSYIVSFLLRLSRVSIKTSSISWSCWYNRHGLFYFQQGIDQIKTINYLGQCYQNEKKIKKERTSKRIVFKHL